MKQLLLILFAFCITLSAAEFGSEKDGYSIKLSGEWKTNPLLNIYLGKGSSKLTAYRTGKTLLVVNLIAMESYSDLDFTRRATYDALAADKAIKGGVKHTTVKIGGLSAARMEYRRSGKKIIQYLLVENKQFWSVMFVGPENMTAAQIKAIDADAASFRILAKPQ